MTQLKCLNWDCNLPNFEDSPPSGGIFVPCFEKLTEGFTDIRMVETSALTDGTGTNDWSPAAMQPSHPYNWDTPIIAMAAEEEDHLMVITEAS